MELKAYISELEAVIVESYEKGVTMEDAERLAAKFLAAQLKVSSALRDTDLDSRMKKTGVKAIRAAIYKETAASGEKKPTEAAIEATINTHSLVQGEQDALDTAEADKAELERIFSVFQQAHHHFRAIAKGGFNG